MGDDEFTGIPLYLYDQPMSYEWEGLDETLHLHQHQSYVTSLPLAADIEQRKLSFAGVPPASPVEGVSVSSTVNDVPAESMDSPSVDVEEVHTVRDSTVVDTTLDAHLHVQH